jgi:hypothetical protein
LVRQRKLDGLSFLFQATQRMSSNGWDLAPGVMGVLSLFTSQIYNSDSDPPGYQKFLNIQQKTPGVGMGAKKAGRLL